MIIIKFKKYGGVEIVPIGYSEGQCHEATEPYERGRIGEKAVVEGQAECGVEVQQLVSQPQFQKVSA